MCNFLSERSILLYQEFDVKFEVRLENGHIIDGNKQVWAGTFSKVYDLFFKDSTNKLRLNRFIFAFFRDQVVSN